MRAIIGLALASLLSACSTTASVDSQPSTTPNASVVTTVETGCTFTYLPDHRCTPGAINPNVTQVNIASTICQTGWTSTIRPPLNESERLKRLAAKEYGRAITSTFIRSVEGDHLISLELGGAPDSIENFWDEPHSFRTPMGDQAGSYIKDHFENYLNSQVCRHGLPLATAQQEIAHNWWAYYLAAGKP